MKTAEKRPVSNPCEQRKLGTSTILPGSEKITAEHLEKLAVVYVRQSSPQQVLRNRESTALQYALAEYAKALGWPSQRVLIIDEDQGQSGAMAENRTGFQHILGEVTMEHGGIVFGSEMSRLARSSKDWHHLFELCGAFGTLLADQEGIYDANDPNDRLLLGLKGLISEVELQTMRNRLEGGRLNKAQRGELFYSVPFGYVILPNGEVDLDPDEQARSVVRLVFEKFDELGSVRSLFRWLVKNRICLPIRPRSGPNKGQLDWRRPCEATLRQALHHPMYAGAYSHGRRRLDPRRDFETGKRRAGKWLPMDEWDVLILDHLPAYITWEQYLNNQERLKQNQTRPDTIGTPRDGCALLSRILICGHCDWRMDVSYRTEDKPYYRCTRYLSDLSEQSCFGLSANVIDDLVSQQVLRALEPAGLELSLKAQADVRRERERLDQHWQQELKRARYDVELAERRYRSVDPENRLVAATLERHWEEALRKEREVQEEYDRFCRQTLTTLSPENEARILALSSHIPALWQSPSTTNADRQAIIRCLVDRIVVLGEQNSEFVEGTIHWAGGYESRIEFVRPVRTYEQLRDGDQLMKRIIELRESGYTAQKTADALNAEGFSPIDPRKSFDKEIARDLLLKLGVRGEQQDASLLAPGEWWIRDLAQELKMPWQTLREWALKGWVHSRQTRVQKLWILWADEEEVKRLRKLKCSSRRGIHGYASELTSPKQRAAGE